MVSALTLIFSLAVALIKSVNCSSDPNCTFSNGSSATPFYVCRNYLSLPQNLAWAGEVLLLEMSEHSNILQTLKNGALVNTGMHNLTKLYLNHCGIEKIELSAFKSGKLSVLGLNFNKIEFLDLEVFKDLPDLELLGLEGNPLKSFASQEFPRMNLIELHLGSCALTEVKEGLLQNLQKLRKLRLQQNQLKTLDWKVFPKLKSLSVVLLQDNPWHCDCKIKFLLDYLDLHFVTWKTPEIIPECGSAVIGADLGVNWEKLNRSRLFCSPMIQMLQYSQGFEAETGIELMCEYSGYPEPDVTWKKNGQFFKGNTERKVVNETDATEPFNFIETLVLPEPDVEGIYECNTDSIAGSDRLVIKVEMLAGTGTSDGLTLQSTTPFNIPSKKKHFWERVGFKVLIGIVLALVLLSGFYLLNRLINKHFPEKNYNEVSKEEEQVVPEVFETGIIGLQNPPQEL